MTLQVQNASVPRSEDQNVAKSGKLFVSSLTLIGLSLAILAPAFLTLVNSNWLYTNLYQPPWFDPYIYLSLFRHPIEYMSKHWEYYPATRVSFIILGMPFHQLFAPLMANTIFKVVLSGATLLLFFGAIFRLVGAKSAFLTISLLATYPFFVSTMGWDYVDAGAIFYFAILYFVTFSTYVRGRNYSGEILWGVAAVFLLNCHFYTISLMPWIGLLYLGLRWTRGDQTFRTLARSCAVIALGVVAGSLILSLASGLMGGRYLFLLSQFAAAFDLSNSPSWGLAVWGTSLNIATWLALPVCTALLALRYVLAMAPSLKRFNAENIDLRPFLILAHYVVMVVVFVVTTFTSVAVAAFWFYTSFLVIPCFIALAVLISGTNIETMSSRSVCAIGAVGFIALLLLFNHSIGASLQQVLNIRSGMNTTSHAIAAVATALAAGFIALSRRSFSTAILAIVAFGYANLLMMTNAQFNHTITRDRGAAFSVVTEAAEEIAQGNRKGRQLRVWIDRSEPNGGFFHGIYITSVMSGKTLDLGDQTTRFPSIPRRRFKPGERVAIMSSSSDWLDKANAALQTQSLGLQVDRVLPINQDGIAFVVAQGTIHKIEQ